MGDDTADQVQLWLVDRTTTEKPSLITHIYATEDGKHQYMEERSISGTDAVETPAGLEVDRSEVRGVEEEDQREQFSAEASRMAEDHDPDDVI